MRFDGEWIRPSLLSVTLAGFGEAIVLAVQYRETVEDVGVGVFRHYYWPWYVHGHGDYVTPTGALPLRTELPDRRRAPFAPDTGTDVGATSECTLAVDPTNWLRHPSPRGGQTRAHIHRRGAVLVARGSRGIQCLRAPRVARHPRRPRPRTIGVGQRPSDIGSTLAIPYAVSLP